LSRSQATDLFNQAWATYRTVLEHNLMEHRQVAEAIARELDHWLTRRTARAPAPRLVDLGCGDLALLPPLLRRLPLASYTGLDLAPVVLPLAREALGPVPFATHWLEGDLLSWARHPDGEVTDILLSSFAIHHLEDGQKALFLEGARQRIDPEGVFLWADVFRQPGEGREASVRRYGERIVGGWQVLDADQQRRTIEHVLTFDHPADRAEIQSVAESTGWQWRWAWQGLHRAEALAVLTPA